MALEPTLEGHNRDTLRSRKTAKSAQVILLDKAHKYFCCNDFEGVSQAIKRP